MAEYRDNFPSFQRAGAAVAAVSVDAPEQSAAVRRKLGLPFPILSDARREVVKAWGILNSRERGGIAKPAVFVVESDLRLRFYSTDEHMARVPAADVASLLLSAPAGRQGSLRRRSSWPGLADWLRALRNTLRFGPGAR